jgi:phage terminase large subunit
VASNNITGKRYIDHWTEAGFDCGTPIKNTGADARSDAHRSGAAMRSATTTSVQDEERSIGLGPEHDCRAHPADAFGYMAIAYEEPPVKSAAIRRPSPPRIGTHWAV